MELLGPNISKENPLCYVGYAPIGPLNLNHLIGCIHISELISRGYLVAILIADVHKILDNTSVEVECYQRGILSIMKHLKVDVSKIKFVRGSEFQYSEEYILDVLKLASKLPVTASKETRNLGDTVGQLLYPIMQAIDENYVGQATFGRQVDIELGGRDQKNLFEFSLMWDPKISYLIHPIIEMGEPIYIRDLEQDLLMKINPHNLTEINNYILKPLGLGVIDDLIDLLRTIRLEIES
jgi:tyrosyl-tRNA synthetase